MTGSPLKFLILRIVHTESLEIHDLQFIFKPLYFFPKLLVTALISCDSLYLLCLSCFGGSCLSCDLTSLMDDDIVIYDKKYTLGLYPCFWHRAS